MKRVHLSGRGGLAAVTFTAEGGRVEKLASWCMEQGIQLVGLTVNDLGFRATVAAAQYVRLRSVARRCRTRLHVVERRGAWFSLRRLLKRPGLLLGTLVFWLLLELGGQLVWSIRFVGIPAEQSGILREQLYRAELREGSRVTAERIADARRALLSGNGDWGWIALNFYRGRLVVEGHPLQPQKAVQEKDTRPYVAAEDATVLANRVKSGFAQKTRGQTVAAGEVLIAASRPARDGSPVWQEPSGEVIGLVRKEYGASVPLAAEKAMLTGRTAVTRLVHTPFGTWALPGQREPFADAVTAVRQEPLVLFGLGLPATVEETLYAETAVQSQYLERETARQFARYACLAALYQAYPDAEILAEEAEETAENEVLEYTLAVTFRANIARRTDTGENG